MGKRGERRARHGEAQADRQRTQAPGDSQVGTCRAARGWAAGRYPVFWWAWTVSVSTGDQLPVATPRTAKQQPIIGRLGGDKLVPDGIGA